MNLDEDILKEFKEESKSLIKESLALLEDAEGDLTKKSLLAQFGNNVDRVMGGAKNLALLVDKEHPLYFISDYCALCKAVSYKASQISNNTEFYNICVALLLDATEILQVMVTKVDGESAKFKNIFTETFLERLKWVSDQFGKNVSETVGSKSLAQNDIDELLKKLGVST